MFHLTYKRSLSVYKQFVERFYVKSELSEEQRKICTELRNALRATEVLGGNCKRRINNNAQQKTRRIGIFKRL